MLVVSAALCPSDSGSSIVVRTSYRGPQRRFREPLTRLAQQPFGRAFDQDARGRLAGKAAADQAMIVEAAKECLVKLWQWRLWSGPELIQRPLMRDTGHRVDRRPERNDGAAFCQREGCRCAVHDDHSTGIPRKRLKVASVD